MEQLKYVKTKEGEVIFFPTTIQHSEFKHFKPVTAGFCRMRNQKVQCYGESYSLNLQSDPKEDTLKATEAVFGTAAMLNILE